MERLTRIFEEYNKKYVCIDVCGEKCIEGNEWCPKCEPFTGVMKKLAEYEDLEEQGLLLRLPCKVGDTLWWVDVFGDLRSSEVNSMFIEQGIDGIVIETLICNINAKEIGKTVFLTKEEAEAALAKMKEGV